MTRSRHLPLLTLLPLLAGAPLAAAAAQAPPALTIGDAARLAARQSPAATGARFRADEFAARARQSRAGFLPELSLAAADGKRTFNTATFGFSFPGFDPDGEIIGPVRTIDLRGRVAAPLFAPAAIGRYRAAQAGASAAATEADAAAEAAGAAAAAAYLRALRAEALVGIRATDSSLAAELLGIAREQLAAGVGVRLDVTRAEAQLAAARAQVIAARNEAARTRLDLLRAVGLPLQAPVALADSLGAPAADDTTSLEAALDAARRDRPDLRAAGAAVLTARRSVGAARAERLPTLGAFMDQGFTSNRYPNLLRTYTWGFQLSVPLFEGFRISGAVQAATAALRQAETRQADLEAQVEVDVRTALLDLASAHQQEEAATERLRFAREELDQARERFRTGVAGNADVVTAQLGLSAAAGQRLDVLAAVQSARIALARARGRVTALP